MKKLFIALCLVLLISCGKQPAKVDTSIELRAYQIHKILAEYGINPAIGEIQGDPTYVLPTVEWLKEYKREYKNYFFEQKFVYEKNVFDCEDFAREGARFAINKYRKGPFVPGAALFFAEIGYAIGGDVPHSINMTIIKENDKFVLVFLEPQLDEVGQGVVTLKPEELHNIDWAKY